MDSVPPFIRLLEIEFPIQMTGLLAAIQKEKLANVVVKTLHFNSLKVEFDLTHGAC